MQSLLTWKPDRYEPSRKWQNPRRKKIKQHLATKCQRQQQEFNFDAQTEGRAAAFDRSMQDPTPTGCNPF